MMKWVWAMAILVFFWSFGVFQNCSSVRLERPVIALSNVPIEGSICLDGDNFGYTVESYFVLNLNRRFLRDQIWVDSDGDGIPDILEEEYGFNPVKRRSNGLLLDSVCLYVSGSASCEDWVVPGCSVEEDPSGFSECDYLALGMNGGDVDGDGIPDVVEFYFGTNFLEKDAYDDFDGDGRVNIDEILLGLDPRHRERVDISKYALHVSMSRVLSEDSCFGEHWKFSDFEIPLVQTLAYDGDEGNTSTQQMAHGPEENVLLVWLVLRPHSSASLPKKLGVFRKLLTESSEGSETMVRLTDLKMVQEWID